MSKLLGGGKPPPMSLFDIVLYIFSFLCPIFILGIYNLNHAQNVFFVFGTFALLGVSFFCKKEREYKNKYLGFFILWSLACVFIHSFRLSIGTNVIVDYINFALLSEGFIYILCGCILFYLIVSYKKNFSIVYPILAINILNLLFVIVQRMGIDLIWMNIQIPCGVMGTPSELKVFSAISIPILFNFRIKRLWYPVVLIPIGILLIGFSYFQYNGIIAVYLALLYYVYKNRHRELFLLFLFIGVFIAVFNFDSYWSKVVWRFKVWLISFWEIVKSPLIGNGFDNSLQMNMVMHKGSLSYRQNDYLNIARDLGLPFLIMILCFLRKILRRAKHNYLFVALLILMISSCFQTGMYFTRIAVFGVIMLALKECENVSAFQ